MIERGKMASLGLSTIWICPFKERKKERIIKWKRDKVIRKMRERGKEEKQMKERNKSWTKKERKKERIEIYEVKKERKKERKKEMGENIY